MFTPIGRFLKISHTVIYFRVLTLLPPQYLPWYLKVLLAATFWYPKANKKNISAANLRQALENLGPVWIKFGQMLSTRKDLLSPELSEELTKLQDKVTPFSSDLAIERIKQELSIDELEQVFASFEREPLATASIAQVHGAELISDDGTKSVVVKITRPNIQTQIDADLSLMLWAAKQAERFLKHSARFRPVEVVQEYKTTILNELNLALEASSGNQLRQNFIDSDDLYIPEIYEDYCTTNMLIMERIDGIPVSDIDQLNQQGTDLRKLAERGVRVFFTQVFRDSFFHADMHPGNIFISKENPSDPKYIGLDFGIIGTLNSEDKRYLAENFVAFFNRDYMKVAQLHVQSGWVPSHVNVEQFEAAIRLVCDPIFNKPLQDISFGQVLMGLFDTARQFEMEVQPQLVLLQKTLLYVEGLGRQLYPQLDLWQTAKPFLEDWMQEQMGFKAFVNKSKQNFPYWLEKAPQIPELLHSSLTTVNQLPNYKQQLINEYKSLQKQNHKFLWRLTMFSLSSLTTLLLYLFGDLELVANQVILGVSGLTAILLGLRIRP